MFTSSTRDRSARYARIASLLVATLAACNRSDRTTTQETGDSMATAMPSTADSASMGTTGGTLSDVDVVQTVMAASSADSATGALAVERAASADVKQYGRDMQREHGELNERLEKVATSLGSPGAAASMSMMVDSLRNEGNAVMGRLRGLEGAAFDSAYIAHAAQAHSGLLRALNDRFLPQATNGELRTLLTRARDDVQQHLERARTLRAGSTTPNR